MKSSAFHQLLIFWIATLILLFGFWYLLKPFIIYLNYFTNICVFGGLSIIAWTIAYRLFEYVNNEQVSAKNRIVLVTGCDSGFGHKLVQRLDSYGFTVFAGVLFPEGKGATELRNNCSNRLRVIRMDVTKVDEVENVVNEIKKTKIPLWGIVNNAGIAYEAVFDWGEDIDVYTKTFDVNVFGVVRVTKHCISLLRQSKGRVINVASLAGRTTLPYMGHYCMAKHCVRVFSDIMRRELLDSGIEVVTIEPTFYKTPIVNFKQIHETRNKIYERTPTDIKSAYGDDFLKTLDNFENHTNFLTRSNTDEVVDAMMKGITLENPKPYYRCCGYFDVIFIWALSHLPETLLDSLHKFVMTSKLILLVVNLHQNLFGDKQKTS